MLIPKLTHRIFLCLALSPLLPAAAQERQRIYISPDDHTDYIWTADEDEYRQALVEMTDYYLVLADKTRDNPSDFQSRWSMDGNFWVWTYEKSKPPADFARLIARIRDGHIGVPLNPLASCYGAVPTEAILRGMYYAGSLERRFNLQLPVAIAMENQTLPMGLGALWSGAGARYSWKGICGCASKIDTSFARPHEIYWWQGLDGSRILMKWNSLFGDNKSLGGYAEARNPKAAIDFVTQNPRFRKDYPYPVIGIFGKGWDDLKTFTDEFVTTAQAASTPQRRVIVSNEQDFFEDFEKSFGDKLPNYSAAFGNEWDLYSASLSAVFAKVRRSVEKLRAAEALSTLVSLQWPEFLSSRVATRDRAWMNLGLLWEHDWTADGHKLVRDRRVSWGRRLASEIGDYVDTLSDDSAFALGGMIRKSGTNARFYVFNPLGWTRTDYAEVPYDGGADVHVIDLSSNSEVPSQVILKEDPAYQKPRQYLRVDAQDVPSVGYHVMEVRPGPGQHYPPAAHFENGVLENSFYRMTIAGRGAVTSLIDKNRHGTEFVKAIDRRAVNDMGAGVGTLEVENAGPVSITIKSTSASPLSHTTRITLVRNSPRIEIENQVNQNFEETYTWAYSFNLAAPDVWHEEVGAILRAKLTTEGGHYSPTLSRLEWLTLNHFVDMEGSNGYGITLSNADCAFMKLGRSTMKHGTSFLDTDTPQIQVLLGGRIDGQQLGVSKQGGDTHFQARFALQTHDRFDPAAAMKLSLEHQNPMVARWLTGGTLYPEREYSLVKISNPKVALWSLKPAEDGIGRGVVARVWNLSNSAERYSVSLATGISKAFVQTHIEVDREELPVRGVVLDDLSATQIGTLRLVP